jgi:hypothetical protein
LVMLFATVFVWWVRHYPLPYANASFGSNAIPDFRNRVSNSRSYVRFR